MEQTLPLQHLRSLFEAVLELPRDRRPAFLERQCGDDPSLRQRVEQLLAADEDLFDSGLSVAVAGVARQILETPVRQLGPWRLEKEIGRGGMGVVYRARRAGAYHQVAAVKLLWGRGDEVGRQRFRLERQILADLDHPGIARLLDGGDTEDGVSYLVMELVEGERIDRYCDHHRLPPRERVRLLREVCAAVEAAHRRRIVHRDLKPSNVLVTAAGQPKLLDFGIAKSLAGDETVTQARNTPLTPSYASPEVLRGDPATPAADVYALGLLLYELLTGSHPRRQESGEGTERLGQARQLRGDLDRIAATALRPDPEERYPDAAALGEDLDRWLRGEPIHVRSPDLAYRLGQQLRRRWRPLAALLLGILLFAAAGLVQTLRARRQAVITQELIQAATEVESSLRAARLGPVRDLRPVTARARARAEELRRHLEHLPASSRGAGEQALGRVALALQDHAAARQHLEAAWQAGFRSAPVALGLALANLERYQEERVRVRAIGDEVRRREGLEGLERDLRQPSLLALRHARRELSRQGGSAQTVRLAGYVEALIAFYGGDLEAAETRAREVFAGEETFYPAAVLAARVLRSRMVEKEELDDAAGVADIYEEAREVLERAAEIGRGDPEVYLETCALNHERAMYEIYSLERQVEVLLDRGESACDRALAIDPDAVTGHLLLAQIYVARADFLTDEGEKEHWLERATTLTDAALAREPHHQRAWINRGHVLAIQADRDKLAGRRPTAETLERIDRLITAYRRARALGPHEARTANYVGNGYSLRAWAELSSGRDPRDSVRRALAAYREGLEDDPAAGSCRINSLLVLDTRLAYEAARGLPTAEAEHLARKFLEEGLRHPGHHQGLHRNFGTLLLTLAEHDHRQGRSPLPHLEAALEHLTKARQLSEDEWVLLELARATTLRARLAAEAGNDPSPYLPAAREATASLLARVSDLAPARALRETQDRLEAEAGNSALSF